MKIITALFMLLTSLTLTADDTHVDKRIDLKAFAQLYFDRMTATQAPDATKEDLEKYLELLADNVGHSHLPWVTDDSRLPDGKEAMRKGMTFYLGAHTEYTSELLNVFTFNTSAIAIRYKKHAKGIHPQNQQKIEYTDIMLEVLEMEGDKVAVIRKYHE